MSADRSHPDYIDRTIETVRNHRNADNCWPQWANILADEIEALRADLDAERALRQQAERRLREEWWLNHGHDYHALYGDDGELQCTACPADFKRQPLDELWQVVVVARAQRPDLAARVARLEQALTDTIRSLEQAEQCGFSDKAWRFRALLLIASLKGHLKALGVAETKQEPPR